MLGCGRLALPSRFSRLSGYLAGLPGGVLSYPSCRAKGSILRGSLEVAPWDRFEPDLPAELRDVLREPPAVNAWLPEALSVAAHYAIADAHGMTDEQVIEWQAETNRRLSHSKLYRAISRASSPSVLLRAAPIAWKVLHQGVKLETQVGDGRATLGVKHPTGLWAPLVHRCTATGFQAVMESSRGANVVVTLLSSRKDGAEYECTWS